MKEKYRVMVEARTWVTVEAESETDAMEQAHAIISMPTWREQDHGPWEVDIAKKESEL